MRPRALVSLAAVAALLLSTERALAEEDFGARFRAGLSLRAGSLIVPGAGADSMLTTPPAAAHKTIGGRGFAGGGGGGGSGGGSSGGSSSGGGHGRVGGGSGGGGDAATSAVSSGGMKMPTEKPTAATAFAHVLCFGSVLSSSSFPSSSRSS